MGGLKVLQPNAAGRKGLDLAEVRERLAGERGPRFWRSLEELADTAEFRELLAREFPSQLYALEEADGLSRRRFVQLGAASMALAGLTGCTRQPSEKIVPYVRQPEEIVPGRPLYFATSMTLDGYARPLLAESHLGRPTKVEGNPGHPASLGATDLFAQASVLSLYDPDRAQTIRRTGTIQTWDAFTAELFGVLPSLMEFGGAGLHILTGTVTSPTLAAQMRRILQRYPQARWHRWQATWGSADTGARAVFGEPVEPTYDLTRADVIVALESDFLVTGPGAVRYARDFAARRRVRRGEAAEMSRFYAVESTPSATATLADHRLALAPADIGRLALALAEALGAVGRAPEPTLTRPDLARWVQAAARDLSAHAGRSLVVAGDGAPAAVHALVHAINAALGNVGSTVSYIEPVAVDSPADPIASLEELTRALRAGEVGTLLILGGNPVYDAPADLDLAGALGTIGPTGRSARRIYVGLYDNETSDYADWIVPESHYLESWGDARSYDGTVTFTQPLIEPLYDSRTYSQILALLEGRPSASDYQLLTEHWTSEGLDEKALRRAIHDGFLEGSEAAPKAVAAGSAEAAAGEIRRSAAGPGMTLVFRPDPTLWDGSFNNNGWLQECPKPLTKLTWDNALLVAPADAQRLGLTTEDLVEVATAEGRSVEVPVYVLPGQARGVVTLHMGHGRRRTGRVGEGTGVDVYPLRTSRALWSVPGVGLTRTGRTRALASTQDHFGMEGRHQVRSAPLEVYRHEPDFAAHMVEAPSPDESLYPGFEYDGYAWGLAVDLNACTGCNACVIACQAENNIPIVGKQQVLNGREMHWIRIDRYFEGGLDDPVMHNQPVMCMHCEQAPCEVVCPVAATVHSSEGLNDMVYNRCVGTRYCSNNCPYKVRRFNFLQYHDTDTPILKMLHNPDVTVRDRGVMEKCSYCVQRINQARQDAKVEGRGIEDGEIQTACQQVCPSQAIAFGDVSDPETEVFRWKAEPTNYGLLAELNTRPRTSYLAKVTHPNPELEKV